VAKHKGLYLPSAEWIKIKNPNYTQAEGRHELFESLRSARFNRLRTPLVNNLFDNKIHRADDVVRSYLGRRATVD
jgi:hypothetical protein